MTYPVASLTLDSARSHVMQGASFIQGMNSSIPVGGSISPEGFVPSILLLVAIIVTVVIVVVILVVVVVAIVGVVILVVDGVSSIIGFEAEFLLGLLVLTIVAACASGAVATLSDTTKFLEFKTFKDRYGDNRMSDSIGVDLTGDEDPIDEVGDTRVGDSKVSVSLGEIFSGGRKSQESSIGDTEYEGKAVSRAIGVCSGGIGNSLVASYACITSIYE
nr:integrase, catalytic region, zinc finger, CCHC-type, peptidase aspartic, catalytic [Tanacetum cinerariifolium]